MAPEALVASTVRFALMDVIVGGVVSTTVTVKLWLEEFPAPSVAVTVTTVVPKPNVEPDACEYAIVTGPTASVAVSFSRLTAI